MNKKSIKIELYYNMGVKSVIEIQKITFLTLKKYIIKQINLLYFIEKSTIIGISFYKGNLWKGGIFDE